MRTLGWRIVAVAFAAVMVWTLFLFAERPAFLRWGTSAAERSRAFVGDTFVARGDEGTLRAVTIEAPASRVWPWVAQLGQDRAGFYSYEILEDLVGCEMPNATRLLPNRQSWKPGDKLWMYPPRKLHGAGGAPLVSVAEGEHLVFATKAIGAPARAREDATWGFYLDSLSTGRSRLIARGVGPAPAGAFGWLVARGFFEPAHYAMERRMLLNVRTLAEGGRPSRAEDVATVALWTLAVLLMLASIVETFRRRRWGAPLFIAIGSALLFQWMTLAQPGAAAGALGLTILLSVLLWSAADDAVPTEAGGAVPARA